MMNRITLSITLLLVFAGFSQLPSFAEGYIAKQGKSTFTIIEPAEAPTSLRNAGKELQKDIQLSTGAKLPIKKDNEDVDGPFISLGSTKQAKENGITTKDLKNEEFRVLTQGDNLYIIGIDTPDGKWTEMGGVSNGTANGVYRFLENHLDVRWLMPGEVGRDVPQREALELEKLDYISGPVFHWRNMPHIESWSGGKLQGQHFDKVNDWASRQGVDTYILNNSAKKFVNLDFNHNWRHTVPARLYKDHPDWFAMHNGHRVTPTGTTYKLETTNQELVTYYANRAIKELKAWKKAGKRPRSFSLSPTDGGGYSESPESKALYDPAPPVSNEPSLSPLMLKFYHDVSKIVEEKYPEGKLAGYIYQRYLFPPQDISGVKFPDNFTPIIAPDINYGYRLYNKEIQGYFKHIMSGWSKVAPKDWYYYDIPNQLLRQGVNNTDTFYGNTANVTPAAPDILNLVFHTLKKSGIKGALIYADPAWSNSAMANYITAKMMWNPSLDAHELQREWITRAYGPHAGPKMQVFYEKLEEAYQSHSEIQPISLSLTSNIFKSIYATHYGELEKLLREATRQEMTPPQSQRLNMIVSNMILLQWRLRNMGLLDPDFQSSLQRTNMQIAGIIQQEHPDLNYFPGVIPQNIRGLDQINIKNVKLINGKLPSGNSIKLPNDSLFLIYSAEDGNIKITPSMVDNGSTFATYILHSGKKDTLSSGLLVKNNPITFSAKAGELYYFYVAQRQNTAYRIKIDNATIANNTFNAEAQDLSISNQSVSTYVYGNEGNVSMENGEVIIGGGADLREITEWLQENNPKNLLKNSGFEDASSDTEVPPMSDWSTVGAPKNWYTWSSKKKTEFLKAQGMSGNGFRINNEATGDDANINQGVKVEEGATYIGTVWVRSFRDLPGANVSFSLRFKTDRAWYKGDTRVKTSASPTHDWEKISVVATVPKGATGIVFMLGSTSSDVVFDNASLYKVPDNIG